MSMCLVQRNKANYEISSVKQEATGYISSHLDKKSFSPPTLHSWGETGGGSPLGHMMVQRFLCRAPWRRIEVWFWRMPRATAIPSSSLKRRTTCQLNLAEHSTYPHFQVFFTRTDTALRGMKRCRCRSLLLPTTRIGTSLLLPSLQVHVGDLQFNQEHKKI